MKNIQQGFTLIELMIVVAIIGILASIAIPSYNSYIDTSNATKVVSNGDEAYRIIKNELSKIKSQNALNIADANKTDVDGVFADAANAGNWFAYLNVTTQSKAPDGADAFAGAVTAGGVIGIATGVAPVSFVISTPDYLSLTGNGTITKNIE